MPTPRARSQRDVKEKQVQSCSLLDRSSGDKALSAYTLPQASLLLPRVICVMERGLAERSYQLPSNPANQAAGLLGRAQGS